jgi:hypothetical protein
VAKQKKRRSGFLIKKKTNLIFFFMGKFNIYFGGSLNSRGVVDAEKDNKNRYVYKSFDID